jgi:aspartyl-tRNA(Asn)/glutamyl-tRNA(Gln) amidotransferase subunit C
MADLSRSDIQHLARLARLELTEEEYERFAEQLTSVVHYVEQLSAVDTSGEEARVGVTGMKNVMRADEVALADLDRESVLNEAPRRDGDFLEVRAVLGGETGAA